MSMKATGWVIALYFVAMSIPVQAQQVDSVTLGGRLIEGGSGRGIPGQMVYSAGPGPVSRATTDANGAFSLRIAPLDSVTLFVSCRVTRRPWGRAIGPFFVGDVRAQPVEIRLASGACREPAEDTTGGVWTGHFSGGFEESSFVPCEPLPDLSNTAYGVEVPGVWLDFNQASRDVSWPQVPNEGGISRYFVTIRGTRYGPGGYGHLGYSVYRIAVDRVLEVRPPAPDDCAGPGLQAL